MKSINASFKLPPEWKEPLLARTLELGVSVSEYYRELVRRDLGVGTEVARPTTKKLQASTYNLEFDVAHNTEQQLRALAQQHEITLASVVMALIYKEIPMLPSKPIMRKFNKDLWTRTQDGHTSDKCRVKLSIPVEWDGTLTKYAHDNNHTKQAGAVRNLIEKTFNQEQAQQS